jgi:hypothetical protein
LLKKLRIPDDLEVNRRVRATLVYLDSVGTSVEHLPVGKS